MRKFFNSTSEVLVGQTYKVKTILGNNLLKKRLNSLGILENSEIKIYKKAPFVDPIVIKINNSTIALRKKIFKNIIMDKL